MINTDNEKNVSTIWKIISFSHGVVITGWLDGFIDFQRNLRFGSKLSDSRVADLRKKADFLSVLSFMLFISPQKSLAFFRDLAKPLAPF